MNLEEILSFRGRAGRARYGLTVILAVLIFHNICRVLGATLPAFKRGQLNYLFPLSSLAKAQAWSPGEKRLLTVLALAAMPFLWILITMTLKRLRDLGLRHSNWSAYGNDSELVLHQRVRWIRFHAVSRDPILAWDERKHFAFGVSEEPPLLKEWSPYGEIHVRHLEEHDFRPQRADFYLTELPGGRTRLDGWTTYENRMWPGMYWRLWTDEIVHQIHGRVFRQVKRLAEEDARSGASGWRARQGNASVEQQCR